MNEEIFNKYLYNDLPPIDFMIRTSGECRISNFMLWQLSYAEFYFPDTYFPDFDEKEFDFSIRIMPANIANIDPFEELGKIFETEG